VLEGLRKWCCGHSELTPEDGKGYAICLRCGAAVVVRLTAEIFDEQMRAMRTWLDDRKA
jgi:hypothetical protein